MNDINSPDTFHLNLNTRFIGKKLLHFFSVNSTNEAAKQEARQSTPEGTVVITEEQTAGKGRLNRSWKSPPGTIAVSVVLYPQTVQLPGLIMIASLAVVRAIKNTTGLQAQIKWPNDVLINGKKVCGILIENELKGNSVKYSVIGIGINVNMKLKDAPEFASTATSLYEELGREVSAIELISQLLLELELLYLSGNPFFEEWRDNLVTLGKHVKVTSGKSIYEGIADSVDPGGNLFLKQSDGQLIKIVAGDVTLRA